MANTHLAHTIVLLCFAVTGLAGVCLSVGISNYPWTTEGETFLRTKIPIQKSLEGSLVYVTRSRGLIDNAAEVDELSIFRSDIRRLKLYCFHVFGSAVRQLIVVNNAIASLGIGQHGQRVARGFPRFYAFSFGLGPPIDVGVLIRRLDYLHYIPFDKNIGWGVPIISQFVVQGGGCCLSTILERTAFYMHAFKSESDPCPILSHIESLGFLKGAVGDDGISRYKDEGESLYSYFKRFSPFGLCIIAYFMCFYGLWNLQLGPQDWRGDVAVLAGLGAFMYGFGLILNR